MPSTNKYDAVNDAACSDGNHGTPQHASVQLIAARGSLRRTHIYAPFSRKMCKNMSNIPKICTIFTCKVQYGCCFKKKSELLAKVNNVPIKLK